MTEQQFKLEVPAQIKEVAEKTIDQAERGFSAFIESANKVSFHDSESNHGHVAQGALAYRAKHESRF